MSKQAVFVQDGERIPYTAGADIAVGDVVPLTNFCGIAADNIAKDETGDLFTEGIYTIPTDTGAAWSIGDKVYWDDTNNRGTKTASGNTIMGYAAAAKESAGTSCQVKLVPGA